MSCRKDDENETETETAAVFTEAATEAWVEVEPPFPEELMGVWYGVANQPEMIIGADGIGTVTYFSNKAEVEFTVDGNHLALDSDVYGVNGDYSVEDGILTLVTEDGELSFTSHKKSTDIPLIGEWYGGDEDALFTITFEEGGRGIIRSEDSTETEFYYESTSENITYLLEDGSTFEGDYNDDDCPVIPHPLNGDEIYIWNEDSLVGTWYHEDLDGTYVIDDDGTGSISVLGGTIKGELEYTYTDNEVKVEVTVNILFSEQSGSGKGTVYMKDDCMYIDAEGFEDIELERE